jgi:predicted amino acid dehydrogenase
MKKFAFLIHPREAVDVGRRIGQIIGIGEKLGMAIVPKRPSEWLIKHLHGRLGFTVCSQFSAFGPADRVEGIIIAVLLTAKQMVSLPLPFVRQRILDTVLYAQEHFGIEGIGLGAYTAPLTFAGRWLASHPAVRIWVTHGDSYATALTLEGIEKVANLKNLNLKTAKIAIVGAYGLIGKALSRTLVKQCDNLILIGRKREKFRWLLKEIGDNLNGLKISDDISDVQEADLIITATTGETAILKSEHLKRDAVVYDIAQPINLRPDVCIQRPDITRVDGAYAQINGIDLGFEMGPPSGATFGCLAETIMQALAGDKQHHVGSIKLEHVKQTVEWAQQFGFFHAPLTSFSQSLIPSTEAKKKKTKKHPLREALTALRIL